jgi:hypothetical protein
MAEPEHVLPVEHLAGSPVNAAHASSAAEEVHGLLLE